jgi:hypothetical protein
MKIMDFFAIATQGFFPTPTPTGKQRMAFAATWGYLSIVPTAVPVGGRRTWLSKIYRVLLRR